MNGRSIELKTISNIRDLGTLKSLDGHTIRKKALIRSALLNKADEKDLNCLVNEYRLKTVIDLRTARERNDKPEILPETIEYLTLPVFDDDKLGVSDFNFALEKGLPVMDMLYKLIVTSPSSQERFHAILSTIVEYDYDKGSILWHCTEGKDRCGLVSALVEHILGVSEEDIYEDYLLTNAVNGPKAEMIKEKELARGRSEEYAEGVKNVFLAREEYLRAALDTIKEEHGSLDTYLTDAVGLDKEKIRLFRERILE